MVELVFILDRSGSMSGLEKDTIGGFNSMLKKQRKESGEAYVTTVLFDSNIKMIHDRENIKYIPDMTEEDYYVGGCTALLDAIGESICHINNIHKYSRKEDIPERTLFIITTDGMENASHKYSYDDIHHMIEYQKKNHKWEFIFLGANIDAVAEARKFGIDEDMAVKYKCDSIGTSLNYDAINDAISSVRKCSAPLTGKWKKNIEKDYQRRGEE